MTDAAHPMMTHRNGDKCIWIAGTGWFVPLDAGGEGYPCEHPEHAEIAGDAGDAGDTEKRYCADCGAAEENHWPGGSRYRSCTFRARQVQP